MSRDYPDINEIIKAREISPSRALFVEASLLSTEEDRRLRHLDLTTPKGVLGALIINA